MPDKKKPKSSLYVDSKHMTPKERDSANFMINLIYLYRKYGVLKTDRMLMKLGTDVSNKRYFSSCFR